MWSLGCVIYELLNLLNQKDGQSATDKKGKEKLSDGQGKREVRERNK